MDRAHRKWLEKLARDSAKERVRKLRSAVKAARANRRDAKRRARETCRTAKAAVREWWVREREALKAARVALRVERKKKAAEACNVCVTGRTRAKSEGDGAVLLAQSELASELDSQRRERIWGGKGARGAPKGAARAREARLEAEDEVRANLSPDETIVYEAIKARLKPGPRMSRTEALQHWIHEHPGEVALILERKAIADVRALEREERAAAREADRSLARVSDAELAERVRTLLPPPPRAPSVPPRRSMAPAAAAAMAPELEPDAGLSELERFAAAVLEAAPKRGVAKFGGDRAFIGSLFEKMRKRPIPGLTTRTLDTFKRRLVEAAQAGLVTLTRADLVRAMDPREVQRSETQRGNAVYHFVAFTPGAVPF